MQTAAGYGVRHITAEFAVGGACVNIRSACPVTERVNFGSGIIFFDFIRTRIALADDEPCSVNDVFSVKWIGIVYVPCNLGKRFLLLGYGYTLKYAVVTASDNTVLILCKMCVLRSDNNIAFKV